MDNLFRELVFFDLFVILGFFNVVFGVCMVLVLLWDFLLEVFVIFGLLILLGILIVLDIFMVFVIMGEVVVVCLFELFVNIVVFLVFLLFLGVFVFEGVLVWLGGFLFELFVIFLIFLVFLLFLGVFVVGVDLVVSVEDLMDEDVCIVRCWFILKFRKYFFFLWRVKNIIIDEWKKYKFINLV